MTRPTHQRIRLVEVDKIWSRTEPIDMKAANGPKQAADALRELLPPDREGLAVLMLNCDYRVTAMTVVSVGTIDTVLVHPREIYKPALLANAHAIVIGHNHPEGDLRASDEDIATTKQIQAAGELLGITCLDHILIGNRKNKEFVSVVAVMLADEARKLGAAIRRTNGMPTGIEASDVEASARVLKAEQKLFQPAKELNNIERLGQSIGKSMLGVAYNGLPESRGPLTTATVRDER